MKKNLSVLLAGIIAIVSAFNLYAEVRLPSIFGDNMVMQQNTEAAIWGTATANATVRINTGWNNKSYTTRTASDGKWKTKVTTPSAGGPYEITISDGKSLRLSNVMIGEVWVCSGQSNMEMPMKGYMSQPVVGGNEAIATSSSPVIRLFTVKKATSLNPQENFEGSWQLSEPWTVSEFSATAYYFGLMLNRVLKVPVGLINTSWGGTRIEPWMSMEGIKNFDFVKAPDLNQAGTISPQTPTVLFNSMINPVAGYGIKGAIWYQGEANRNEYKQYEELLPGLISNWRTMWGIGDFPFYYVQIAPYDYGNPVQNSAYLREAQLKASTALMNAGMACIMDIGEKDCIHPRDKKTGADRLAFLALTKAYGKSGFTGDGPVYKSMKVNGQVAILGFDNAPNGLTSFGRELSCFEIAGANKRFYPARASISGNTINVYCPAVAEPVAVRYAFKDFVVGDLFNTEGIPASSFRTDDWE